MVAPRAWLCRSAMPGLVTVGLVTVGCGAAPPPPAPAAPPAARTPAPKPDPDAAFAPFPFTSDEIRAGCPEGRSFVMIEEVPDQLPMKRRTRFMVVDDERATFVTDDLDERDRTVGEPKSATVTWDELRHHAAYPKASTTITETVTETPLGTFHCKRYVVVEGDTQTTACFARELPGPPVELQVEKGGRVVRSLTMVRSDVGR